MELGGTFQYSIPPDPDGRKIEGQTLTHGEGLARETKKWAATKVLERGK